MWEARRSPVEAAALPAFTSTRPQFLRTAWEVLAVALMIGVLLAPAIVNGFPFIFADTGGYLLRPIEGQLELGRSALYGAFLLAGIAFDFWPVVIVQAAATCWIIVLTLRAFALGQRPGLALAVVLVLASATSLPWYVGQLMPDIFVPLCALALYLLAFHNRLLNRLEMAGLGAVVAFAMASHMSILGMAVILLLSFACL
jgi:hypothetical protein